MDLSDLFVAIGEAAQSVDRGVVLLFDEIQFLNSTQLESLIQALHRVVQRKLPITMVGAGLPQIAELAGDAKSYAERLLTFPTLGNLDPDDAEKALRLPAQSEGADYTSDALDRARETTGGYPYFIQELGHAVWRIAEGPTISLADVVAAEALYQAKLEASFFRVRLDRTTVLQRAYLRAMAELGPEPQRAADVAQLLGRTSSQVAPTRADLIAMGLLYAPEHGYAGFTVPHFDSYLLRVMPTLEVPPLSSRSKKSRA